MEFESRADAGQKLGQALLHRGVKADVTLGLPRGGVIVAAEVAPALQTPLNVLLVRKIGHPHFREFAVGALAEADTVVLDRTQVKGLALQPQELDAVIAEESARLQTYRQKFGHRGEHRLAGQTVIVIDDGLATGATLEAAVHSARKQGAQRIIAAVPVSSVGGAKRISAVADEFYSLFTDPEFEAVGQYYNRFGQTSDEEVLRALALCTRKGCV